MKCSPEITRRKRPRKGILLGKLFSGENFYFQDASPTQNTPEPTQLQSQIFPRSDKQVIKETFAKNLVI